MVALKTERRVFVWKMLPEVIPRDASVETSFDEIYGIIKSEFEGGKAFAFLDSDGKFIDDASDQDIKNCIFIADIKESGDGSTVTILLNRGDPDVAHPSFMNPSKRTVTPVPPPPDQVQGWSAHLVIRKTSSSGGRHDACFERMTGVSSTLVQRFMDKILDDATAKDPKYEYDRPVKKGKKTIVEKRPYKVRLSPNKIPSESLKKDIKQGFLSNVTLIRVNPKYDGPGNPQVSASVQEKLTISTRAVDNGMAEQFIADVIKWGRTKSYDEIQFKIEGLPGNTSSSPRFDIEISDAMDTLYSRSIRLTDFGAMLETCYASICIAIEDKMKAELANPDHW